MNPTEIFRFLPAAAGAAEQFAACGFAHLPATATVPGLYYMQHLANTLLRFASRKDLLMPQTNWSPRHMDVAGARVVTAVAPELQALYSAALIPRELERVTGLPIKLCESTIENVILTALRKPGDTHGWHRDDYAIAFVVALQMPPPGYGGELEFRCADGIVRGVALAPGDAYVLRSDLIEHRVAPLQVASERVILNFTYSLAGACVRPNGTADLLCA